MRNSKKQLEARRIADRKRKQELVDAIVGPETYAAIDRFKPELKAIDDETRLAAEASVRLYAARTTSRGREHSVRRCSRARSLC